MTPAPPTRVEPSPAAYALIDDLLALYMSARGPHIRFMMATIVDAAFTAHDQVAAIWQQRMELAEHDREAYRDAMVEANARAAELEERMRQLRAFYEPKPDGAS